MSRPSSPPTFSTSTKLIFAILAMLMSVPGVCDDAEVSRDALQILQQHCAECHGSEAQESQLRLDSLVSALTGGNSGEPTIVPGSSTESDLIRRVISGDTAARMPPDGPALSDSEVAILRRWIDSERIWDEAKVEIDQRQVDHWSFQPVQRPSVPESTSSKNSADSTNALDAFIQAKLSQSGLKFSSSVEAQRKIRRLALIMHGLPPTPEEVELWVSDTRPDSWERQVDRFLASPRYGQRWASHWLDVVRFGETDGFETNRERPNAYRFRDWVIEALNEDLPYDRFVRQQIAGDAMGQPVATGFLVAGPNDIVKGQDALLGLMQRQDELTDMVNTVGTAFLGLSTGCARCHNHKFDPISQSDFYALQAVFAGVQHGDRVLPMGGQDQQIYDALNAEAESLQAQILPALRKTGNLPSVSAQSNSEIITPTLGKFIRLTIMDTSGSEPCIDELEIFSEKVNVALASSGALARSSGDFQHPLHNLQQINDGRFGNAHSWIASTSTGCWVTIELPGVRTIDGIQWSRDRESRYSDRVATRYRFESSVDGQHWQLLSSSDARQSRSSPDAVGQGGRIRAAYDLTLLSDAEAKVAATALDRLDQLEKQKAQLLTSTRAYAGQFQAAKPIHRLHRGDPLAPREQVGAGAIAVLGKLDCSPDSSEQECRSALASWITRPDQPLTARVMANRLWQFHFGTGIVDTPSDFGANGALPTHPELLDWMASDLMASEWSLKKLQRSILTSRTWQQDSSPQIDALSVDATARLLWRFPPRRLEGESIRDCMLVASGQLDMAMGGPGYSAFEVALENVRHYFPKSQYGPSDWRHMVYMTKVRQEKDSVFGVFDCPDGSQVTPKRSRSTTPLQALNMLNSSFVNQQAELLSERLAVEASTAEPRIARAYQLCFGRPALPSEVAEGVAFVESYGWPQFARAMLNANEFVFIP